MKKNLLFVIPSLMAGGGEKSLVNLLLQIDFNLYNVDLFLFSKTGVFMNSLPKEVGILELPFRYKIFKKELKHSVKEYLKLGQVSLAYSRLMFAIKNKMISNKAVSEQYTWKYQSRSIDTIEKEYDAVIGYMEKSSIYFSVEKVKSKKKIGWIHTNYSNSGMDNRFDDLYFKQLDHIVTVSEECAKSLKENFNHLADKIKVIYNIVSPKSIHALSERALANTYDTNYINIITVARLSYEKGIDIAIRSCRRLLNKGLKVKWYVIGDGMDRGSLETLIESRGLRNSFILLGIKENPYPYIKNADIYVQPSRYEGKSIAIDEAKILYKPIVVTNYETAKDQIQHGINGFIAPMNEEGLSNSIEEIIRNCSLKKSLISSLKKEKLGTEEEVYKLYEIFN